jgi:Na+:H+ antiporter, NhaA family
VSDHDRNELRRPWSRSDRFVPRVVVRPLQEFLRTSTASVGLLTAAALIALVWANSPWHAAYEDLWRTGVSLRFGAHQVAEDLGFWVNEGLMTVFFMLAGLEIKRELVIGELRDRRAAVLPIVGAVGGMLLPAAIFVAITHGTGASDGWGAAMPTDLAFALGILVLAARAAPPRLRPFLLTLAIADDILTVAVVALFYSGGIAWAPVGLAAVALLTIAGCRSLHVRHLAPYLVLGVVTWAAVYWSGVHPALAGVAFGLLTPALPFQRPEHVSAEAHRIAEATTDDPEPPDADAPLWFELSRLSRETVSPLARVEHALLPWVNLVALPLFALANAGVRLSGGVLSGATERRLVVGLVLARVAGKTAGITGACLATAGRRFARLPAGVGSRALTGAAAAAGAPFSVSLFVVAATFPEGSSLRAAAQVGVLASIVVCGAVSTAILRLGARP